METSLLLIGSVFVLIGLSLSVGLIIRELEKEETEYEDYYEE